jgi:Family of unknown function (DUF6788)
MEVPPSCPIPSLPWKPSEPTCCSSSKTWETCVPARSALSYDVAASPPVIVHNRKDPGHGPQFRLTRKIGGKTVTESFASPAAFRKAQREIAEFHRFQTLSAELVSVNEKICQLRPVEEEQPGWTSQEKKRLLRFIKRLPRK